MRNEEQVRYTATEEQATQQTVNATYDARIKLVGNTQPGQAITSRRQLEKFCWELVGESAVEEFHLICVNAQCQVVAQAMISRGDISSVSAYPANIAKIALLSNASCVFLTHNHPGGTCRPSGEDIRATQQIVNALKLFDIMVLDHLIVTQNNGCYSFREHGDI